MTNLLLPGANLTTVSYNASATSSLVRFKNKQTYFLYHEKTLQSTATLAL
jgi:hypothetical protein